MATTVQDTLFDTPPQSNHTLENHLTQIPGTAWAPLVGALAGSAQFTGGTTNSDRVRVAQTVNHARYLDPGLPATGEVDITGTLHGTNTIDSVSNAGALVLALADGTVAYDVNYVHSASGWQVNKVQTGGLNRDAKLNNAIGASILPAATDQTILIQVRNASSHPRFIVKVNGSTVYDQTDSATAWSSLGKRTGITLFNSASTADDHGAQIKGTWTVTDFIAIIASPTTLNTSQAGQVVTLVGNGTAWTNSTAWSLSGAAATGSSITAQPAADGTHVTLTLTVGSTAGTLTITDDATPANSVSLTVQNTTPPSSALTLAGPSSGLTGQASGDFTISGSPAGSAPSANTTITLGDNSAGGTWSPATVILGPTATTAKATYTAPANPGGTPRTTRTLSATGSGLTDGSVQYVAITPATTYTVTVPPAFIAGVASLPITVALPSGDGVPGNTAVFLSDGGAGGQFSAEAGTLTSDSGSFQVTYTAPHGVTSVTISTTNNGGLADPAGQARPVSAASNYSMAAPKVGPAGRTSTAITLTLTDALVSGTVTLTLADAGHLGTWSGDGVRSGNLVDLTQGAPVQTVYYTPAPGVPGTGEVPVGIPLSVNNNRGLVDPPGSTYTVYDPVNYGEIAFLALYSQFNATGQAATIGMTVYGKGQAVVVPHTTQYTEELGTTGDYIFVVPVPLLQSGAGRMDPPAGQTQGYSQAYSAQGVSPVLAPADVGSIQTEAAAALAAQSYTGIDVVSLAEAQSSPQKATLFILQYLIDSIQDAAGNLKVLNKSGAVIANREDHNTTQTLKVSRLNGTTTIAPGVD